MKALLNDYEIPFHGLKEGIHEYDFDVSPEFFQSFDNTDYTGGRLKVKVLLHKEPQLLILNFSISGYVRVICDLCLEEFDCPVTSNEVIYIKFGADYEELDNNIVIIPQDEIRINIAQFIFEFAILNLPVRKVHPLNKDGISLCNPEMLKKIAEYSNHNYEHSDPRWDILRNLL